MWQIGSKSLLVLACSSIMLFTADRAVVTAWQSPLLSSKSTASTTTATFHPSRPIQAATPPTRSLTRLAVFTKEKSTTDATSNTSSNNKNSKQKEPDAVETTEKYGLEAGLFQSLRQENGGGETAKSLLQKYGIAYLATSIPLALISFVLCYVLVDAGVDVAALLKHIGIEDTTGGTTTETAGTLAIAYAAHKAASPIRFPPTVLLTPVVARLIGKEPNNNNDNDNSNSNEKA